jgi:hypothetical protein
MPWTKAGNIRGPEGPVVPLDGLTDVTAPASTPAGKVLATTATGQWGPVDLPANGVPPSPEDEVAYVLYSYGSTLQWVLISDLSQEIAMPLFQLTDVIASDHVPAGKLLGTSAIGTWTAVDPPGWGRWIGTQAQYDALATKDPKVLYVITA